MVVARGNLVNARKKREEATFQRVTWMQVFSAASVENISSSQRYRF